mmetsp:Transcript_102155/g.184255  ORF Transcript_102155/g.184255 Transcript_102155/m.184255 type:complete len:280 (+) Transcript_102155:276-1115(+)
MTMAGARVARVKARTGAARALARAQVGRAMAREATAGARVEEANSVTAGASVLHQAHPHTGWSTTTAMIRMTTRIGRPPAKARARARARAGRDGPVTTPTRNLGIVTARVLISAKATGRALAASRAPKAVGGVSVSLSGRSVAALAAREKELGVVASCRPLPGQLSEAMGAAMVTGGEWKMNPETGMRGRQQQLGAWSVGSSARPLPQQPTQPEAARRSEPARCQRRPGGEDDQTTARTTRARTRRPPGRGREPRWRPQGGRHQRQVRSPSRSQTSPRS